MQKLEIGNWKLIFFVATFSLAALNVNSQTFSQWKNAGEEAMNKGDYHSASIFFSNALDIDNKHNETIWLKAEACRKFNDYEEASKNYRTVMSSEDKEKFPLAPFYLGQMEKNSGHYEEASKLFAQYLHDHKKDSGYFAAKAIREIDACDFALKSKKDSGWAVRNAGEDINSYYSDFGAHQSGDSVMYYSSLRFERKKDGEKKYVSRILKAFSTFTLWENTITAPSPINLFSVHNCNSALSPDGKFMVFTRCMETDSGTLRCDLYETKYKEGKWSTPVKLGSEINQRGFTTTQPSIGTRGAEGYVLYFSSDRTGGSGGMDIWFSNIGSDGKYSAPKNPGSVINSVEDEITPFFHSATQTLYFSSTWHLGFGGYDIFKSKKVNDDFMIPENIGMPLNSSANDLYYFINDSDEKGFITSNRVGSMFIKSQTCCYDIYDFKRLFRRDTMEVKKDTISEIPDDSLPAVEFAERINDILPLKLFFHNDYPDPRSYKTETNSSFKTLCENYLNLIPEFEDEYSKGLSETEEAAAVQSVNDFFELEVKTGYNKLERFASLLQKLMEKSKNVSITITGFTSPLAPSQYNDNLARRRISSVMNYLESYNNGSLKKFIDDGTLLLIEKVAQGERKAKAGVSDDLKDQRKSVYSPDASYERRIEVTSVSFEESIRQ